MAPCVNSNGKSKQKIKRSFEDSPAKIFCIIPSTLGKPQKGRGKSYFPNQPLDSDPSVHVDFDLILTVIGCYVQGRTEEGVGGTIAKIATLFLDPK